MTDQSYERLQEIVRECAEGLFESLGASHRSTEETIDRSAIAFAASIGYTGGEVRGALAIATTNAVLTGTHPSARGAGELDDAQLADWVGELANQLLGRIKNRLLRHDITIFLSTPVVVVGDRLRHATPHVRKVAQTFDVAGSPVEVRFEVEGDLVFAEVDPSRDGSEAVAEGELTLF